MVLISDGISKHVAHVYSKKDIFRFKCARNSKLIYDISTMVYILIMTLMIIVLLIRPKGGFAPM